MTDGSWYPDGCCGGCIAIVCTYTYQYTLYPVVIPISLLAYTWGPRPGQHLRGKGLNDPRSCTSVSRFSP